MKRMLCSERADPVTYHSCYDSSLMPFLVLQNGAREDGRVPGLEQVPRMDC